MKNIVEATRDFESWLGKHTPLIRDQLAMKHKLMAKDPMRFLRGTFYRWSQLWPEICSELAKAPTVLCVGDLHIASFGTWRDAYGRLVWGVDDFDEAYPLPYTNDLVRLGASAALDASENRLGVGVRRICDVILDGYRARLKNGARPFVLEDQHRWLHRIALQHLDVPVDFWRKLDELPRTRRAIPRNAKRALLECFPEPRLRYNVARRIAGIGSLGHPRYVAIARWCGGRIAMEAKKAAPSACAWTHASHSPQIHYQSILDRAVRAPDPFVRLHGDWLVRRLAPDSSPIDIETMKGQRSQDRLLHAMAQEAANIHAGTRGAARRILDDLDRRAANWLRSGVKDMAKAITKDWKEWKKSRE